MEVKDKIAGEEFTLQPLCDATRIAMQKLHLAPTDRLYVKLDDEGRKFLCSLKCVDEAGNETTYPGVSGSAQRFFDRVPESHWLGSKDYMDRHRWRVGATDFSALLIYSCWPMSQVCFTEDIARKTFEFLLARFALQHRRAASIASFKTFAELPAMPKGWIEHPSLPLADYQKAAVLMSLGQPSIALFMDRGTGKTATAIATFCLEARKQRASGGKMYRVLIVCPVQVCLNWKMEIQRFATVAGKVVVVRGGPTERIKGLIEGISDEADCDFGAVIINYDSLAASIDAYAAVPWDHVVADESHCFKSPATKRWKAMKKLSMNARRKVVLTGTPVGNSPMDLWTQLEFLGEGLSGFQDFKNFREFHGEFQRVNGASGQGVSRLIGIKNVPLIQERLARLSFAITKEEAGLKLPDKVYDVAEVTMTTRQSEIYERVAEQLSAEIESLLEGGVNQLTAENILTRLMRLAQITSGFVTYDRLIDEDTGEVTRPQRIEQIDVDNPKVKWVVEELTAEDHDPKSKTIIWCCFVEDIRVVMKALKDAGVNAVEYHGSVSHDRRDEVVRLFNSDPTTTVLVANPQTAGEGLDLLGYDKLDPENSDTYCSHEIFFSQNWSAILRAQAEDRAHRRGTRMPVRITDLVIVNTIDDEIRARVRGKQEMAKLVTDLRDILKAVLGSRSKDSD